MVCRDGDIYMYGFRLCAIEHGDTSLGHTIPKTEQSNFIVPTCIVGVSSVQAVQDAKYAYDRLCGRLGSISNVDREKLWKITAQFGILVGSIKHIGRVEACIQMMEFLEG
jgi:hypothetical protein